jgi:hypothetical protein
METNVEFKAARDGNLLRLGILLFTVLAVGLILSIFRNPAGDEIYYLNDALHISDCLKEGRWIGNEYVGFHGFLFKIPAALLLILTGPSIFVVTLTNVIIAVLAVYLSYLVFLHFFDSQKWALAGAALVFTSIFFLRALATFKRDSSIVLALLLFIYLNIKKKNKWLIGLSLLLVLDAKESVFFMILPGFVLWVVYREILTHRQASRSRKRIIKPIFQRLFAALLPAFIFIFLMLATALVPLNLVFTKIVGLNQGGLDLVVQGLFAPEIATRNPEIVQDLQSKFMRVGNYIWYADYDGKVEVLPQFFGKEKHTIVKLIKPPHRSTHPEGGHKHTCIPQADAQQYSKGDEIIYSFWYKTTAKNTRAIFLANRDLDKTQTARMKIITLIEDGKWHYIEAAVPVTKDSVIQPELRWPHAMDMVLYVAGYNVKKKNSAPTKKNNTLNNAARGTFFGSWEWLREFWKKIILLVNLLVSYIGKLFYSRTFSFTSMPRFIIVPAFVMSIRLFRYWKRSGQFQKLIAPLILWCYLFSYLLRSSMGRYLLPVVPLIMLFFVSFMAHGLKDRRFARNTLLATILFTAVGLSFESNFQLIKVALNLFFLAGFWLVYRFQQKNKRTVVYFKMGFILLICLLAFSVFLGTSYFNARQLGHYFAFGYCGQMDKISRLFEKNERIWINFNRGLVHFHRHSGAYPVFKEGVKGWKLKEAVPKAALMNKDTRYHTYSFKWDSSATLQEKLQQYQIRKVVLVVSTLKNSRYMLPLQMKLPELLKMQFLELEKEIKLKNKIVYLFKVRDS